MAENLFLIFFIPSVALWFISILLYRSKRAWRFGTLTFSAGVIVIICALLSIEAEDGQRLTKFVLSVALMFLYLWLSVYSLKPEKTKHAPKAKSS